VSQRLAFAEEMSDLYMGLLSAGGAVEINVRTTAQNMLSKELPMVYRIGEGGRAVLEGSEGEEEGGEGEGKGEEGKEGGREEGKEEGNGGEGGERRVSVMRRPPSRDPTTVSHGMCWWAGLVYIYYISNI
jgi:hypothetical protein